FSLADPITALPPSSSNKWDTANADWDRFAAVEKALLTALTSSLDQHTAEPLHRRVDRICDAITTTIIAARFAASKIVTPKAPNKWHTNRRIQTAARITKRAKREALHTDSAEAKREYYHQL